MVNTTKLKIRMIEKDLTMGEVATNMGCTPYTLGQKMKNRKRLYVDEAEKLSNILDIPITEFADYFIV